MSGPSFLFVRHGETDWNVEGRLQGTRDVDLNARGRRQAAEAGRRLAGYLAGGPSAVPSTWIASPLARARDTMAGLRTELGLDPTAFTLDDRLKELSFGAWEGLTWPEIKTRDPVRYRERRADKWGFVPPGGESYADLAARLRPWADDLPEGAIVVAHGGVARALMVILTSLSPLAAPETDIRQGHVLRFADKRTAWL